MIPKTIHYCWFGHGKKGKLIEDCIASWRKYLPEYDIVEWNESNIDVHQNEYISQAYKLQKWAYVSDFVRMKVLYEYGGIYFDVDVEVIKPFPKSLLELQSFSGYETFSGLVSPGLVYACMPGDKIVKEVLESYASDSFENTKTENMITINKRISSILDRYGYRHKNMKQVVNGLTVFPNEVFCGYDGLRRKTDIHDNTLTVHHYAASWLPWQKKIKLQLGTLARHVYFSIKK